MLLGDSINGRFCSFELSERDINPDVFQHVRKLTKEGVEPCQAFGEELVYTVLDRFFILDIIANKFLRLPAVNSKVVQSTGDLHHKIVILFFRISENVFDNATSFNPSNDVLNHNPDT